MGGSLTEQNAPEPGVADALYAEAQPAPRLRVRPEVLESLEELERSLARPCRGKVVGKGCLPLYRKAPYFLLTYDSN